MSKFYWSLGIVHVSIIVGVIIGGVGQELEPTIVTWRSVFTAVLVTVVPFFLGYLAGTSEE